jgi:glycosyltransferase involved in cell wall biosynthesis
MIPEISMKARLRVLIIAHELSPVQGSECAVGWNLVNRIAKYHDLTVIYLSKYKKDIQEYVFSNGNPNKIAYIDIDYFGFGNFIRKINSFFFRIGPIGLPLLYYIGYKHWQKAAFSKAQKLHRLNGFDLVHQITQITFREPGYTWKLGIPFIWGPTGGIAILPGKFYSLLSWKAKMLELIRSISNKYQSNYSIRVKKATNKASVIYTYSNEDKKYLLNNAKGNIKILLDVGTYQVPRESSPKQSSDSFVKALWCGQLTYRKAPVILLKAIAKDKITRERLHLQIIGGGPMESSLQKMANDLDIKNIEWIKNVDHSIVFELMSKADFFIHTSLREATSSVIPEALSVGLPVICHDINGMSIAVDETCGIKIPMLSPEESINGFHEAIKRLILDREYLNILKEGTKQRAKDLSWDKMADTIANDYFEVINSPN